MPLFKPGTIAGVVVGALYGLAIRLGLANPHINPVIDAISTAFLFVCPFSVGAIAVLWGAQRGERVGVRRQLGMACAAMGLFLLGMFATFLEGLICIVLVVPVFMLAAMAGGLAGGVLHNGGRVNGATLPALALLPLLLGPLERHLPPQRSEQTVTTTLHVAAPPAVVFDRLLDVRGIRPDELGFSFVHLIGLPRPLEARMNGGGPGAVRTSRWERNVWFQEVVTASDPGHALRYRFVVPQGAIPREALDEHVEINGAYFELLDGGYALAAAPDGGTDLSLTTRFMNKSRLTTYGNLWGRLVLADFHRAILVLMKSRAERAVHAGPSAPAEG